MTIEYDLQRFLDAQEPTYHRAFREITNGKKNSHWMWFIFPQLKGLAHSSMAKKYAIQSVDEAIRYFSHPILGKRLKAISEATLNIDNKSAYDIFGSPDNLKLKSSMTLFDMVQNETKVFQQVLDKYFNGEKCKFTKQKLSE